VGDIDDLRGEEKGRRLVDLTLGIEFKEVEAIIDIRSDVRRTGFVVVLKEEVEKMENFDPVVVVVELEAVVDVEAFDILGTTVDVAVAFEFVLS